MGLYPLFPINPHLSLSFPITTPKYHLPGSPISCQKGLGLAYRKRIDSGIVPKYCPESITFWDGSKMTPYHKKFLEVLTLTLNLKALLREFVVVCSLSAEQLLWLLVVDNEA